MRKAKILVNGHFAGILTEVEKKGPYYFEDDEHYAGEPVSLTMPVEEKQFEYNTFPPFFDGLLPEGMQLEALVKRAKIDSDDFMLQLITVGHDLVGNVTLEAME